MRKMQRGVTIIELILVVGLMSAMTMLTFFEKQYDLEQAKARNIGGQLFQYNNAVRSALAKNPPTASATYSGSAWLKSSACGGMLSPGEEYLPCDFPLATVINPISFGNLALTTVVSVTGTAPDRTVTATTSTSAFSLSENGLMKVRSDLAGIAVLSAASAVGTGVQNIAGGVSPIAATTESRFNSDPITGVMTFVSSNTAANDIWLRTDGSNGMHSSLVFDSVDPYSRQILGASLVQNVAGQALFLGTGSGLTAVTSASVVVDSSAEVLGAFRVRNTLTVDGTASVAGKLTVASDIAAGGSITTAGNLVVSGATSSQVYYDSNDSTYYVDPNGSSNLNAVAANYVSSNGANRENGKNRTLRFSGQP
ncbi:type II secretion system protein [Pseudomonas putida]